MLNWIKGFLGAIVTVIILFLACKISMDIEDEARRIIGFDTCNYKCNELYDITDQSIYSEDLITQQVQSICQQTEDMTLRSVVEVVRKNGE